MNARRQPVRSQAERDKLAIQWLGLAVFAWKKLKHQEPVRRLGEADAVSAGHRGILHAAELWDPARGVRFVTYAYRAAVYEILRETRIAFPLSVPMSCSVKFMSANRRKALAHANRCRSLHADDQEEVPWRPEEPTQDVHDDLERMREALEALPERLGEVLRDYYFGRMTLEQVGKRHGFTRERARQIVAQALNHLRKHMGLIRLVPQSVHYHQRKPVVTVQKALRRRMRRAGVEGPLVNQCADAVLHVWDDAGVLEDGKQALRLARMFDPAAFDWQGQAVWFEAGPRGREVLSGLRRVA